MYAGEDLDITRSQLAQYLHFVGAHKSMYERNDEEMEKCVSCIGALPLGLSKKSGTQILPIDKL